MNWRRHQVELTALQREVLDEAHPYACERYDVYRRRFGPRASFDFALAWGRNVSERRQREYAHDTGAVR